MLLKKLMNWVLPSQQKTSERFSGILVWAVVEGPYTLCDLCDCEGVCELPEADDCMLLVRCTEGESLDMIDYELWLPDFESAYKLKNIVMSSVEPVTINV